ncbi:DUF1295 domain-containing protein [Nocardioides sp. TRM66260-LWL]|uniref:DUF1295 domain-containing protein n=1 Tax=Nocardioides sp. TRM66260-LWL TaxID=2874478 RepID=UPI001CC5C4D6|nr:DUF1295 domain-containing protein [Nocardioides sp. TRM66260-LWL]MBZ5735263.1 DUF1295 domain-containing protein [Nocardioides sp. TRM66260-LWL]
MTWNTFSFPPERGRRASLVRVAVVYAVAVLAAAGWLALGPTTGRRWLDALLADVVATLVVFAASRLHRCSSLYDAYWSVAPPLLLGWWWATSEPGADRTRLLLAGVVVGAWAVRLTVHWARLFPGLHHEDWRYPLLRERAATVPGGPVAVDLLAIHLIPTLQVFLACVPLYVLTRGDARPLGWLDAVALVVGLGAVLLEGLADAQMLRFIATAPPGTPMRQGLWGRSRHPNYLGELLLWVSVALFGLAAAPDLATVWWQPLGAVAMLAMFLGASIPMMEERSLARRPAYQQVLDEVPMLLPRLRARPRGRSAGGSPVT